MTISLLLILKSKTHHTFRVYKFKIYSLGFLFIILSLAVTILNSTLLHFTSSGFNFEIYFEKPSIVFSDALYTLLPSVHRIKEIERLPELIRQCLEEQVDSRDLDKFLQILEKNTFCEINSTIKLKKYYSSFQEGAEYDFNCSNGFINLAQMVGWHMTNFLKNPYTPNNHWAYDWMGNSSTPTTEGRTFYHNTSSTQFRIRTLCDGKVIESIISE